MFIIRTEQAFIQVVGFNEMMSVALVLSGKRADTNYLLECGCRGTVRATSDGRAGREPSKKRHFHSMSILQST
jgi:hypothetical protein